jgi:hypothetical protein
MRFELAQFSMDNLFTIAVIHVSGLFIAVP